MLQADRPESGAAALVADWLRANYHSRLDLRATSGRTKVTKPWHGRLPRRPNGGRWHRLASKRTSEGDAFGHLPSFAHLYRKFDKGNLQGWYQLGKELLRLHPEPPPGEKRHYGAKIMESLVRQLTDEEPRKTISVLWRARRLAARFTSWTTLKKLAGDLPVWHVLRLLSADPKKGNKSSMQELCDRCVAEDWSHDRLMREIQADRGRKQLGSGRPCEPRESAAIAVQDLLIAARRWMTYHRQCLGGPKPLLKHPCRTDYNPNVLHNTKDAIQTLEEVQEAIHE